MKRSLKYAVCGGLLGLTVSTLIENGPRFLVETREALKYWETGEVNYNFVYTPKENCQNCLYATGLGALLGFLGGSGRKEKTQLKVYRPGIIEKKLVETRESKF